MELRPQQGPQELFLSTSSDVAVYGGAAGGGKTWSLLAEAFRNTDNPNFGGVIFRRTSPQIKKQGSLWDQSEAMYPQLGGHPLISKLQWDFPSGASISFSQMEHEKDKLSYQGSELPFIGFDELTHFSRGQFMYMFSRNRSTCGVKPYIRATCNPDSTSFVREMIDWWIGEDGLPILERSGVIRWFIVLQDEFIWGDTAEELVERYAHMGQVILPKSFTFIAASIYDNKILMEKDPGYLANLMALPRIDREQLLGGNWNVSPGDGIILTDWIQYYDELPPVTAFRWSWDTAIKEKQENDYSVGQLWAECENGHYLVEQVKRKMPYPELKRTFKEQFRQYPALEALVEDKASGQQLIQDLRADSKIPIIAMMPGQNMGLSKTERVNFVSTYFEAGKVFVPRNRPWTKSTVTNWCNFPNVTHDDDVDAMSQYLSRIMKWSRQKKPITCGPVTTGNEGHTPRAIQQTDLQTGLGYYNPYAR